MMPSSAIFYGSRYLGLTDADAARSHAAGHVCGDDVDLDDVGRPVGAIRISFGYYNTKEDADKVVSMLEKNFISVSHNEIKAERDTALRVHSINIYPVKSCAPMSVGVDKPWKLLATGLEYDRHWAVMGRGGKCLTQKKLKGLTLLQPYLDLASRTLTLSYPTMPDLIISLDNDDLKTTNADNVCIGDVCNEAMEGYDCGAEAAGWLQEALGEDDLRLVRQKSRKKRDRLSLANEAPLLVLNLASAERLRSRWLEQTIESGGDESDVYSTERLLWQFRANVVVSGGAGAFDEDGWSALRTQTSTLSRHGKCTRCGMIAVDQGSGEEVRGLVRALTYMTERGFAFGVLFSVGEGEEEMALGVGEAVAVDVL